MYLGQIKKKAFCAMFWIFGHIVSCSKYGVGIAKCYWQWMVCKHNKHFCKSILDIKCIKLLNIYFSTLWGKCIIILFYNIYDIDDFVAIIIQNLLLILDGYDIGSFISAKMPYHMTLGKQVMFSTRSRIEAWTCKHKSYVFYSWRINYKATWRNGLPLKDKKVQPLLNYGLI